MRKFILFILFIAGSCWWFFDYVKSGSFEKLLDNNPDFQLNSSVEYYWAVGLELLKHTDSALYRYRRVLNKYPKSRHAPLALICMIDIFDNSTRKKEALDEAEKFLEKYPGHPESYMIRKRIEIIKNSY